jgi:hypothetical protein
MSYLDDLVKLRYLAPMREAASSAVGNVNTFRSKETIKDFLDKIQTNDDGTGRPGGVSALDLSDPKTIQKLVGMESGTMSKLMDISGGKMDTPEIKGIQDISDRILKGMNLGSDMTYKTGQTEIGMRGRAVEEKRMPFQNELDRQQALLASRMPVTKDYASLYASMNKGQTDELENIVSAFSTSENPEIKSNIGPYLDAIKKNPITPFEGIMGVVKTENPKLNSAQVREKTKKLFTEVMPTYRTKAKEKIDFEIGQAKIKKVNESMAEKQKQLAEDPSILSNDIAQIKKENDDQDINMSDSAINRIARNRWLSRQYKELSLVDPDYQELSGKLNNPNELYFPGDVSKRPPPSNEPSAIGKVFKDFMGSDFMNEVIMGNQKKKK